ncbi:hypothetical protein PoB_004754400 [Plakobranchus ocellatus]|uniref:Uncharacterized protein n=1 Tax=Plakobranchus ocellatus TaxID=259542 RepID=A0AAV4BQD4_9GAST|nr:hypothetical protein PoB_004754400 [Plakobranchus ocellatus]
MVWPDTDMVEQSGRTWPSACAGPCLVSSIADLDFVRSSSGKATQVLACQPQQSEPRLSSPPSDQRTGEEARTHNKRVPAHLGADLLFTVPLQASRPIQSVPYKKKNKKAAETHLEVMTLVWPGLLCVRRSGPKKKKEGR